LEAFGAARTLVKTSCSCHITGGRSAVVIGDIHLFECIITSNCAWVVASHRDLSSHSLGDFRPNKYSLRMHGYIRLRMYAFTCTSANEHDDHVHLHTSCIRECIYIWRSLLAPNSYVDVVRRDRMPQSEYLLCTYVAVEVLT